MPTKENKKFGKDGNFGELFRSVLGFLVSREEGFRGIFCIFPNFLFFSGVGKFAEIWQNKIRVQYVKAWAEVDAGEEKLSGGMGNNGGIKKERASWD